MSRSILHLVIIVGLLGPALQGMAQNKKIFADLEVVSVTAPEYVDTIDGSMVVVRVRNKGKLASVETSAKLSDLDITADEARKRKFEKLWVKAIEENNALAGTDDPGSKPGIDSDRDWELLLKMPALEPGGETELIFMLKGYWIYDPNCEIEVEVDTEGKVEEQNRENNKKAFVGWG